MSRSFLPRGLIAALAFLTRIPVPSLPDYTPEDQALAAHWYPVVGLIIGGLVFAVVFIGAQISPFGAAFLALAAWVWVTGALHLDGLGDVADGLGAAHGNPDRFLEVVKDPHIGSFGVVAIVLAIAGKLILLVDIANTTVPVGLLLIPAWARWGPLVWRQLVPSLGEGRGKSFSDATDWLTPTVYGLILAGLSFWLLPSLLLAIPLMFLIAFYWRWRLQGMTGDCHGASIEVSEVVLLLAVVIAAGE